MKIAIIGAGPAGLALASLLAPEHEVHVFERAPKPTAVGAGILLQPSGMQVLAHMGLLAPLLALGARIDRLYGTLANGWPVMDMQYQRFDKQSFGLGLSRHALVQTLSERAIEKGAVIHSGQVIEQLRTGQGLEGFDMTVLCNGSFSQLREATGLQARVRIYPWGALWALVPKPALPFDAQATNTLRQWYEGAHYMLGLMPTGFHDTREKAEHAGSPWVSLFWSLHERDYASLIRSDIEAWKDKLSKLAPQVAPYLQSLRSWEQLSFARYAEVKLAKPFNGKVIAIGDSAHAMSPQLGQGTNMALMDALQLAQSLREHPPETSSAQGLSPAFAHYTAKRRWHLATYQFTSHWLTPMFQSDAAIAPALRNISFWPASKLPGAAQLSARLLTGYLFHPDRKKPKFAA